MTRGMNNQGLFSAIFTGSIHQGFWWSLAFVSAVLLLQIPVATAQTDVQVVTKKIERNFNYRDGYEVNIEGEKADIDIRTWDKKEIEVIIELSSKHADKATAEKDLKSLIYVAQRLKNKIYLRNYLSTQEGAGTPQSQLSARYTITIPEQCPIYLKSHFGEATVVNHNGRLRINGEFSKIDMQNVQGAIQVQSRFGDILGRQLNGDISINSRRTNMELYDLGGHVSIDSYFGDIKLFASRDLLDLMVRANQSDVYFYHPDPQWFGYSLAAQNGKINLPDKVKFNFVENLPDLKKVQFKPNREYYANVTISVNFGSIFIQKGGK